MRESTDIDVMQLGQVLREKGPKAVIETINQTRDFFVTDTSLRDAHQSILATRLRTSELLKATQLLQQTGLATKTQRLFSSENWGGATFDVCLRFLQEDPFERLMLLKREMPNTMSQMLLRGKNAVGYGMYADNVIEDFITKAACAGMDVFRVFDAFNDLD